MCTKVRPARLQHPVRIFAGRPLGVRAVHPEPHHRRGREEAPRRLADGQLHGVRGAVRRQDHRRLGPPAVQHVRPGVARARHPRRAVQVPRGLPDPAGGGGGRLPQGHRDAAPHRQHQPLRAAPERRHRLPHAADEHGHLDDARPTPPISPLSLPYTSSTTPLHLSLISPRSSRRCSRRSPRRAAAAAARRARR